MNALANIVNIYIVLGLLVSSFTLGFFSSHSRVVRVRVTSLLNNSRRIIEMYF